MKKTAITAKDGASISAHMYNVDPDVKGIVIVSHGFGEHAVMYSELADTLVNAGYGCILFDQRGHGEPPDDRKKWFGIIPGYECFLDDIVCVTEEAKLMAPGLPVILYGHSMGGNIVANELLRDGTGYACAVLEAPWLALYKELSPPAVQITKLIGRISPGFTIVNKLSPGVLTSDESRAKGYVDDPLYHNTISFRMFSGIKNGCVNALANAKRLPVPTFVAYAENDKVLSNKEILQFAADAGDMATLRGYDSCHAIHNDVMREEYFRDVIAFMDANTAGQE